MAKRISVVKVGRNKNHPRIWIEGKYLSALGFKPGSAIEAEFKPGGIEVRLAEGGKRKVSGKRGKSVIDLNSDAIAKAVGNADKVEIRSSFGKLEISPAEAWKSRVSRARDGSCGSIFSGGGLLDEAAKLAGYSCAFGVEINPDFADAWQSNHDGKMFCGDIAEIPMAKLPKVDLLVGGIPCEPFSAKRNGVPAEEHPLADMSFFALMVAKSCNPRNIVFEEAPRYLDSAIGKVTAAALRRMGYNVEGRVVKGVDYGSLSLRSRTVLVARTAPGPIPWPKEEASKLCLGDILLPADDPRCEWFDKESKPWLFKHWENQAAKGNCFGGRILKASEKRIPAITKRYFAGQGDGAVVAHPTDPNLFRWLTIEEVRLLMGMPESYKLPAAKTVAGQLLGQGVLVDTFAKIISAVAPLESRAMPTQYLQAA